MNTLQKLAGTEGCFLIVGHTEAAMPAGYAAYALIVRTDDTTIATVDEYIGGEAVELTDASWETVALLANDLITLRNPVVNITLTNDADSVWCYLMETDYEIPEG